LHGLRAGQGSSAGLRIGRRTPDLTPHIGGGEAAAPLRTAKMIEKRSFATLGGANHGWLTTSFADYHDPERMHWGRLRVWNDDEIASGTGFPLHPHANMEIITYVTEGGGHPSRQPWQ
jgi:Pirin